MKNREAIIRNYIEAYNNFDTAGMVENFANSIVFENDSDGKVTMTLSGLDAFKEQAATANSYFSTRKQTIQSFRHSGEQTTIEIQYEAILAEDLPNGLKKGQELKLEGKSVFTFLEDKIVKLVDIN